MTQVTTAAELEALIGRPLPTAAGKVRHTLAEVDRLWLAAASFAFVASSDEHGNLDVSPKGDPAGFAKVIDDWTIALPERPGNRRADGFHNILLNPHVGIVFVVQGRGDMLRVNRRARLLTDAPYFDDMIVRDHRPLLALEVAIDEVFFHCSEAFLRSKAGEPDGWTPDAAPLRAVIAQAIERPGEDLAALDEYYGPSYADKIYG